MKKLPLLLIILIAITSCNWNKEIEIESLQKPLISLDNNNGVYTVKIGKQITISPTYKYVDGASYLWTSDGKTLSTSPALAFTGDTARELFVTISVSTSAGTASEEIKIVVTDLEIPFISYPAAAEGLSVKVGEEITLAPDVTDTSLPTTFKWTIDGNAAGTNRMLIYKSEVAGIHDFVFTAENEDGSDSFAFTIKVTEKKPFSWQFPQKEFNVAIGRTICIKPYDVSADDEAEFVWNIDNETVQKGKAKEYLFKAEKEGRFEVSISCGTNSQILIVNVCPPEGTYFRQPTAASTSDISEIYEYTPAPGQFINENVTITTPQQAVEFAKRQMKKGTFVSLGGFGGYIVLGFDHSISNSGSYDLGILGNAVHNSSEPGIVWVMQDENGDGLPNDTWYELKGSDSFDQETIRDYSVTYYRPAAAGMHVQWTDNQGNSGRIDYLKAYHRQDFYYPAWIETDSYTLRGTRLKERNYDSSGNGTLWFNCDYGWGYADNFSTIDRLSNDENSDAAAVANHFKISDAVRFDGSPANLKYIDFIKVQTAVNAKSGWVGELSTEIFGAFDKNLVR